MTGAPSTSQDLHVFLDDYRTDHPEDVVVIEEELDPDQDVTALAVELWTRGQAPILLCRRIRGLEVPVVTNVFASRRRVAALLRCDPADLHTAFQAAAAKRIPARMLDAGPILDRVEERPDLSRIPMLRHFDQDAQPYLTSAIVIALDPDTGIGNASYHRCMVSSPTGLATSLHSRGHLWRYLAAAAKRGESLRVAVVVGGHPLFMLACAARVGIDVDERDLAGGLFGEPLEMVPTPRYRIGVPATADLVLEGVIDPERHVPEGPFGEYSGYASSRSTNNLILVETVLHRSDPWMLDVVSGNAADHLNLGRIPRESELAAKLRERFPDMVAIEYPVSGTHFHCYISLRPGPPGQARQVLMAILGLDPYVKLAVAVDEDVDVRTEQDVLWAIATRFQADRDLFVVSGLSGSMLDPSAQAGVTARMGIDATRGPGFEGERVTLSERAVRRARAVLDGAA